MHLLNVCVMEFCKTIDQIAKKTTQSFIRVFAFYIRFPSVLFKYYLYARTLLAHKIFDIVSLRGFKHFIGGFHVLRHSSGKSRTNPQDVRL